MSAWHTSFITTDTDNIAPVATHDSMSATAGPRVGFFVATSAGPDFAATEARPDQKKGRLLHYSSLTAHHSSFI